MFRDEIDGVKLPATLSFRGLFMNRGRDLGNALWEGCRMAEGHLWRQYEAQGRRLILNGDSKTDDAGEIDVWRLLRQCTAACGLKARSAVKPVAGLSDTIRDLWAGTEPSRFNLVGLAQGVDYEVKSFVTVSVKNHTDRGLYKDVAK